MARPIRNLSGKRFTRLLVKGLSHQGSRGRAFWLCVCDCGAEKSVASNDLTKGTTKSCGCYARDTSRSRGKPYGHASFMSLYAHYSRQAFRRGYAFELTQEDFRKLTSSDCHYCGMPPSGKKLGRGYNGHYVYNGIDRKDNSRGYLLSNCVPCCKYCNVMKMDQSVDDFMAHVRAIVNHQDFDREKFKVPFNNFSTNRIQVLR